MRETSWATCYGLLLGLCGIVACVFYLSASDVFADELDCPRSVGATCFRYDRYLKSFDQNQQPKVALEVFNTTYAYNVEPQGTNANRRFGCQGGFCSSGEEEINGYTVFGDFTGVQLRYSPISNLSLYGGVFFAIPFGGEDTIRQIRPIVALSYQPYDGIHLIAGTLQVRHPFHDAVFDDFMYFVRPIEQGLQFLVDQKYYRQDLFINWYQENTKLTNERFDVGYVGKLMFGPLRFNVQYHWDHAGGEIPFPDFRSLQVRNNTAWMVGPEIVFSTPLSAWPLWEEVGVSAAMFGTRDQPNTRMPEQTNQGHGSEVRGWVIVNGVKVSLARWKSDNFFAANGDRFFGVSQMTEVNVAKFFDIHRAATIELGAWLRFVDEKSGVPTNIVYLAVHWDFSAGLDRFLNQPSGSR